ncbi:calcium uptake protein 3, mitochondrial isoform X1 [Episyrphus balteatus]|uniref:calcium uptake protein 3, mitochondrial isoform X1 n=1 Tax=Episyrphus balteatus TaxID=286459 RepID=UPI0024869693|nr:calcium uptake protein 3, mitochondrial isoform X1 [Episyrphus balteatus]
MAFASRLAPRTLQFSQNFSQINRNFGYFRNAKSASKTYFRTFCIIGGGIVAFTCANLVKSNQVQAMNLKKLKPKEDERFVKLTARERRFIKFSSVEYNGQLYMTPLDFLDSVVEQEPRPRLKRRALTDNDIEKIKDATPALKKGSVNMFRDLRDKGIISYTEYLFLLSILTKPQSGFRIAFNMFDTDGNQRVDKNEFLVIQKILGGSLQKHQIDEETRRILQRLVSPDEAKFLFERNNDKKQMKISFMEKIFSGAWKDKRGLTESESDNPEKEQEEEDDQDSYIDDEEGLQRRHKVDTTLQVHFFGRKGNQDLNYDGFYKFMDNLQTEVLELEFSEFSKGNPAITEVDFAKILLRYTYLDTDEYDMFLERLLDRVKDEKGIMFHEFKDFCRFLNNLDDFTIAMRMYTLADRSISKDEFSRAVMICTGYQLTSHLIETVFAIFDEDGDGLLSYKEFIAIMKDRLHRGFKSTPIRGFNGFKQCLRDEMNPVSVR